MAIPSCNAVLKYNNYYNLPSLSDRAFPCGGGKEAHRLTEADLVTHNHTYMGHVLPDKLLLFMQGMGLKDVGIPVTQGATTHAAEPVRHILICQLMSLYILPLRLIMRKNQARTRAKKGQTQGQ